MNAPCLLLGHGQAHELLCNIQLHSDAWSIVLGIFASIAGIAVAIGTIYLAWATRQTNDLVTKQHTQMLEQEQKAEADCITATIYRSIRPYQKQQSDNSFRPAIAVRNTSNHPIRNVHAWLYWSNTNRELRMSTYYSGFELTFEKGSPDKNNNADSKSNNWQEYANTPRERFLPQGKGMLFFTIDVDGKETVPCSAEIDNPYAVVTWDDWSENHWKLSRGAVEQTKK